MLNILISAYTCEPDKGSEAGIGWNWIVQMSKYNNCYVITRANNKTVIESFQDNIQLKNVKWIYYDLPVWARFWKKGARGARLYYYLWQLFIYLFIRKKSKTHAFDIVHHVTFGTYWLPSFLSRLPVPFVWGPVGGGESAPRKLYRTLRLSGKFFEYKRDFIRYLVKFDPFLRLTAKKTAMGIATSKQTEEKLKKLGVRSVKQISNVALPLNDINYLQQLNKNNTEVFRFISIGRILHWKGFHLALHAFATLLKKNKSSKSLEYLIIGEGPELEYLKKLAFELHISKQVKFWGNIDRKEVLNLIEKCDILLHPSLHDSGGWVCAEAMAAARPVICLDIGGPAVQVSTESGIKINPNSTDIINEIYIAMQKVVTNKVLKKKMAIASKNRIMNDFSWEKRGQQMQLIYNSIANKGSN